MNKIILAFAIMFGATLAVQGEAQAKKNHHGHHNNHNNHNQHKKHFKQFKKSWGYNHGHSYNKYSRRRCHVAGRYSIKRSLRNRGYYGIRKLHRNGILYSARAVSPNGYLVKLKINGCNYRIVKRRTVRPFPVAWQRNNNW